MSTTINWGILGAGNIAGSFAGVIDRSVSSTALAIASRSREKAEAFGERYGVPRRYEGYDALLADPDVRVVYVATPHTEHARWVIRAAEAGKHVLCEKPLGVNAAEVERMIEAARRHDVFLMEAFMYRFAPQTDKIVELVRDGALGEVRMIQASFGFRAPTADPNHRLLNPMLAGGGILDVGCYPVSFARLIAGVAQGKPFADPAELKAIGRLEPTGVDGSAAALLSFPAPGGDIVAQVACSIRVDQNNVARIYGTEGALTIPRPWDGAVKGGDTKLLLHRGHTIEEFVIEAEHPIYAIQADVATEFLAKREAPPMAWDDSLGNARALDRWRAEIGLRYPFEPEG